MSLGLSAAGKKDGTRWLEQSMTLRSCLFCWILSQHSPFPFSDGLSQGSWWQISLGLMLTSIFPPKKKKQSAVMEQSHSWRHLDSQLTNGREEVLFKLNNNKKLQGSSTRIRITSYPINILKTIPLIRLKYKVLLLPCCFGEAASFNLLLSFLQWSNTHRSSAAPWLLFSERIQVCLQKTLQFSSPV